MSSADQHEQFMAQAIEISRQTALEERSGEPFGAVIVRDGVVIAAEGNSVNGDSDPTAHAEINAIRAAGRALGTWDLSGCVLYASSRCCPMCYGAAHWAGERGRNRTRPTQARAVKIMSLCTSLMIQRCRWIGGSGMYGV